jgi:hypothetical protein
MPFASKGDRVAQIFRYAAAELGARNGAITRFTNAARGRGRVEHPRIERNSRNTAHVTGRGDAGCLG